MATEFRLSYTANDINNRLGKIDILAEKSEIPKKVSDLTNDSGFVNESYVLEYAQPKGDYALRSEIPEVPVVSVNGKTGVVVLDASDVGALPDTTVIPSIEGLATEAYVSSAIEDAISSIAESVPVDTTLSIEGYAADAKAVGDTINELNAKIEQILYKPIDVMNFRNNVGNVEIGSCVGTITFTWNINKTPTAQNISSASENISLDVDVSKTTATISDLNLTKSTRFTLTASDVSSGGKSTDTIYTDITFLNGVYYGVIEDGVSLDSTTILQLVENKKITKVLQHGLGVTFTATPASTEKLIYMAPTSYGTPMFVIDGFTYQWNKTTIMFTNASGYEQSYDIWLSGQSGLDKTTVVVSKEV